METERERERENKGLDVGGRERGRHKGVDKVAIAHGTQLHASPRALRSLSLPLLSSRFFSLHPHAHAHPSLPFSSRSTAINGTPLPPFGSVFQPPFTTGSQPLTSHYPLGISEGTIRSRKSARQLASQRCSCRESLSLSLSPSSFEAIRDRSLGNFERNDQSDTGTDVLLIVPSVDRSTDAFVFPSNAPYFFSIDTLEMSLKSGLGVFRVTFPHHRPVFTFIREDNYHGS